MQKYIQKIGFILLILCASKMALNAQEMKWSNPIKLKGGANFPKVLGENSNGIFLMRYRNRFYTKSIFLEQSLHKIKTYLSSDLIKGIFNLYIFQINKTLDTVNQDELLFFKNLLSSLEIPSDKIESISASLIDWIDGDDFPDNYNGAEDFYYSNLNTPYLTSNQYMQNISELRKVKGVTEVIYKKIEPYICALPTNFKFININSISLLKPKILVALSEKKLSDQEAISILEDRPLSGYENIDEFFNDKFVKQSLSSSFSRKKLNAESFYFNLESQIKYDEFTFIMNSRIIKDDEDMKIISRKIGNFL